MDRTSKEEALRSTSRVFENVSPIDDGRGTAGISEQDKEPTTSIPMTAPEDEIDVEEGEIPLSGTDDIEEAKVEDTSTLPHPQFRDIATDPEKQDLVIHYAEFFAHHITLKFTAPDNNVTLLTSQTLDALRRSRCTTPKKFHAFFDHWAEKRLSGTPDVRVDVGAEVNKFTIFERWWWERCVAVEGQDRRREFVGRAFEIVKSLDEDGRRGLVEVFDAVDELGEEFGVVSSA